VSLASPLLAMAMAMAMAMAENDGVAFQLGPWCHGSISTYRVAPWLLHQRTHLVRDRRASGRIRIHPFLPDQVPVPGKQSARRHEPVQPQKPGQQPCQDSEHGTVSPVSSRARPADARPQPHGVGSRGVIPR
jgi:hypothetical protein